ncbi:MAG: T9SS type A sorting domain-containing protein [Saprospiraceae bacterium]|nr:T9SS type A sorting domain-containing protein [Saprospiraceae bacterium]
MKKIFIVALVLLLSISSDLNAEWYNGGELTWECTSTGKYKFILKLYRECYHGSSTPGGPSSSVSINTTVPGFSSINLTRVSGSPTDISPICNPNSAFSHIYCPNPYSMPNSSENLGAVQEHIYTSDASYPNGVPLTGKPPANGWMFYYLGCCRISSTNISGMPSYRIRAIMYPFNNMNFSTCFENSPVFGEKPITAFPTTSFIKFNPYVYDIDRDSLSFKWAEATQSNTSPVVYDTGYSYLNPFGTTTNLDFHTGEVTIVAPSQGSYLYVYKVESYRHGDLISEVFREVRVAFRNTGTNNPPEIKPPFINPLTGLYSFYNDTVLAGDQICFNITASDFEFLPNGTPQTMTLEEYGVQFGNVINTSPPSMSTTSGCINPPCATLSPAPGDTSSPLTGQFGLQTQFCWQTTYDHLFTNYNCHHTTNIYNFRFKVYDDYCPVPATNTYTITIVVDYLPILNPPINILVITDSLTGNNTLSWTPPIDTFNILNNFEIYSSTNINGPFTYLDTSSFNLYTHIGANGTSQLTYYYIKSHSYYSKPELSVSSDTVVSSYGNLMIDDFINTNFKLSQNIPNPTKNSTIINYYLPKSGNAVFKVVNIVGEQLYSKEYDSQQGENKIELNISNFESGVYYYSLEFDGVLKVKKMVVLK